MGVINGERGGEGRDKRSGKMGVVVWVVVITKRSGGEDRGIGRNDG